MTKDYIEIIAGWKLTYDEASNGYISFWQLTNTGDMPLQQMTILNAEWKPVNNTLLTFKNCLRSN